MRVRPDWPSFLALPRYEGSPHTGAQECGDQVDQSRTNRKRSNMPGKATQSRKRVKVYSRRG